MFINNNLKRSSTIPLPIGENYIKISSVISEINSKKDELSAGNFNLEYVAIAIIRDEV